jgi:hypothetical protein
VCPAEATRAPPGWPQLLACRQHSTQSACCRNYANPAPLASLLSEFSCAGRQAGSAAAAAGCRPLTQPRRHFLLAALAGRPHKLSGCHQVHPVLPVVASNWQPIRCGAANGRALRQHSVFPPQAVLAVCSTARHSTARHSAVQCGEAQSGPELCVGRSSCRDRLTVTAPLPPTLLSVCVSHKCLA